jgi:hypothetical protein
VNTIHFHFTLRNCWGTGVAQSVQGKYIVDFDGLRLSLCTAATNGHNIYSPDDMSLESNGGMLLTGKTEELGEKPVPV